MTHVVRWGRSAYESDADLAGEAAAAAAVGATWALLPDPRRAPTGGADVLVVNSAARVTGDVLDAVRPSLVLTTTSGFEHVDVRACEARGVLAARCPIARRDAVVEHTIEALIRLFRHLPAQEAAAHEGRWARGDLPAIAPRGLTGARVAVIGLGVIGARVAAVLEALGAQILGVDPNPPADGRPTVPLDDALALADAVTVHASASPSAIGLLDARRLAALRRGCVVVNTARGDLMDPLAAARLVHDGHLGGLACDVFPEEPWPHLADWASDQVLLTPHASGYTVGLGARVADEVGRALSAWAAGAPIPHRVAPLG
jgi:phosphoglycerate dehydrogenase-like enzyme